MNIVILLLMQVGLCITFKKCHPREKSCSVKENVLSVQMCIAHCLNLTNSIDQERDSMNKKVCGFSSTTGRAMGDNCKADFFNANPEKKIMCSFDLKFEKIANLTDLPNIKVCDFIKVFDLVRFNMLSYVLYPLKYNIKTFRNSLKYLRQLKVKILVQIGWRGTENMSAHALSIVAKRDYLRERFTQNTKEILDSFGFDGIYIAWTFPNCPENQCSSKYTDHEYAPELLRDLSRALRPLRLIVFYSNLAWSGSAFTAGNLFSPMAEYVDYYALETFSVAGQWDSSITLPSNLIRLKTLADEFKERILYDANVTKKILFGFTTESVTYELDVKKYKIGSVFNPAAKQSFLPYGSLCTMMKNGSFTVVKNASTQHFAFDKNTWLSFDDFNSLKEKVSFVNEFGGAGIYVESLYQDDIFGSCGCRDLYFLRMVGELLKGGECSFTPCF